MGEKTSHSSGELPLKTLDSELGLLQACRELQDGVYVKDLTGRYLMANASAAAALGREVAEIVGRRDVDIFPDDWQGLRANDEEVMASGTPRIIEEPVVVGGELRTYLSTKAPLRDQAGKVLGLIGISTDITSRKAAEEELRRREATLAEAQTVAQVGSWEWDLTRGQASWSKELYRIFGVDPQVFEPTYEAFLGTVHPDDRGRVAAALDAALESGADYETEYRIVRPGGEIRTVLARARVFTDLDGQPLRMVGAGLDVTDRKRFRERLEAREAVLNVAQELTDVGSFEWDVAADQMSWSDGLYRIFGFEPGAIPATLASYLGCVHPDERAARGRSMVRLLETGLADEGEHRIVRPDGKVRWVELRIRALANEGGGTTRLVGGCQDITVRKLATQALELELETARARALRDPLTGLANRTLAFDRLEHAFALAQRRGSELAVLFIDVDGFKWVNDRFGHPVGDALLTAAAQRMRTCVRGSDTLARIGGDEFLVLCEEAAGTPDAPEIARRLHEAFASPFELGGSYEHLSISVGVSSIADRRSLSAKQLVEEADAAMYEAKRRGPGGYELFQP